MKALGTDIGTIHFVGIGGIGMSGIAEVMHQLGYKVQGSDVAGSYVVEKLRKEGIPVAIGHSADNLGDAAVVVCSTAIKDNNPEVVAAAERQEGIGSVDADGSVATAGTRGVSDPDVRLVRRPGGVHGAGVGGDRLGRLQGVADAVGREPDRVLPAERSVLTEALTWNGFLQILSCRVELD